MLHSHSEPWWRRWYKICRSSDKQLMWYIEGQLSFEHWATWKLTQMSIFVIHIPLRAACVLEVVPQHALHTHCESNKILISTSVWSQHPDTHDDTIHRIWYYHSLPTEFLSPHHLPSPFHSSNTTHEGTMIYVHGFLRYVRCTSLVMVCLLSLSFD